MKQKEHFRNFYYDNIIYPIYQLKHGIFAGKVVIQIIKKIDKTQWLTQDDIAALQYKKLKSLIEHIFRNVPYYQKIMKKIGIKPEDIKSINDLQYFPILTKTQIRGNMEELISTDIKKRKVIEASTGGSTGEPLRFIRDWKTLRWTEAAALRGMSWAQYRIESVMIDYMSDGRPSWLGTVRGRMINNHYFPAFSKEKDIINQIQEIRTLSPFCLTGYASNLYRIAVIFHNHSINDIKFQAIFSTGEMLYDHQRKYIENQFNGRVFDYYGCNEVGSIAYECDHHKKHISEERLIVETTDSLGYPCQEGVIGNLTITDIDNFAMPFIRYKNGDIGILDKTRCECGRGLQTIGSLSGRSQDFLRTLDGNYVPAIFFPNRFKDLKGLDQYQIIQTDIDHITLKIVKNRFFTHDELADMVGVIKTMIGDGLTVDIEEERHIPLTREGKNRLVISHVPVTLY
jgi:phenylacetate-CoA ligase